MKRPPYFPYFTADAALWAPVTPGFTALAGGVLGNAATAADGFDVGLGNVSAAVAGTGGHHRTIKSCLTDFRKAIADAAAIPFTDLDAQIAAATSQAPSLLAGVLAGLDAADTQPDCGSAAGPLPVAPVAGVLGPGPSETGGPTSALTGPVDSIILSTGAEAAVSAMATGGLISAATAAPILVAIPIVGAAVAVVLLALHFIGHGCGAPCIEGSKAEQIYEAAADNLYLVYKLGMISAVHAIAGMAYLISAGTHHLQSFNTDAANRGITNMTTTIHAEVRDVQVTPAPKAKALDLNAAHAVYVTGPGWYPESLAAAAQLTDEILNSYQPIARG